MIQRSLAKIGLIFLLTWVVFAFAGTGSLFNVSETGSPDNVSIILCLNAKGSLSCQNYNVTALTLNISTTIPNHVYPSTGIKINTPGY